MVEMTDKMETVQNAKQFTAEDLMKLMRLIDQGERPNKLPDHWKPFRAAAAGARVSVLTDARQNIARNGVLRKTTSDSESKRTGFDVVYRDWSAKRQQYALLQRSE